MQSAMLQRIRDGTAVDPELNAPKDMIHLRWPSTIQQVSALLKPHWSFGDELAVEDGIAIKGHRIIIPAALQKEILTKLHSAHQGTEKTKLRARTLVYWRVLNKDEIFEHRSHHYLLVADYFRKFPIVRKLSNQMSGHVIDLLKTIFAEYGIPAVVYTDQGTQFTSEEFRAFAVQYSSRCSTQAQGTLSQMFLSKHTRKPPEESPKGCFKQSSWPQARGETGASEVLPWQVC